MRRLLADATRAAKLALGAIICGLLVSGPGSALAGDLSYRIIPATFSPALARIRSTTPAAVHVEPKLTPELLAAYVERQQKLKTFQAFTVSSQGALTETTLLSYIARQRSPALDAITAADLTRAPVLTSDLVADYARSNYVPTLKRVKQAASEELCLAQAIYHEARGEPQAGQLAVINIIVNRAMSKKYPSTICGVVFQNADNGLYRCQFTFACDGRSDIGREPKAWQRARNLAAMAFRQFQRGERPGVVPNDAMYYHTTAVAPKWSNRMNRVAAIGAHIFYAAN